MVGARGGHDISCECLHGPVRTRSRRTSGLRPNFPRVAAWRRTSSGSTDGRDLTCDGSRLQRWSWLDPSARVGRRRAAVTDLDAAIETARAVQRDDGPRAALPLLEQALAEARARRSRRHEGLVLGHLGTAHKNLADYAQAMELQTQALAIKRELGDEIEQAKTLNNIGLVEEARGNCAKALAVYTQSLEIFTRLDQPQFAASVLNNEALCHDALGQFDRSMANYERALALHRTAGNEVGESRVAWEHRRRVPAVGPLS